jgi:hypothetical protein
MLRATEDFTLMYYFSFLFKMFPTSFGYYSSLFTATFNNPPSAGCISAANLVCKDGDIFSKPTDSLKQILW